MLFEPTLKAWTIKLTCGHGQHQLLLLFDRRGDLETIQHQNSFHRRVSNALVAIKERVIQCEGVG